MQWKKEHGPAQIIANATFHWWVWIFRNNYRSLKGFYLTPANLPYSERRKEDNNFTLTLDPMEQLWPTSSSLSKSGLQVFEKGVKILVNGIPTTVCAFTMAFTGDMPQQAANSGAYRTMRRLGVGHVICPRIKMESAVWCDFSWAISSRHPFEATEGNTFSRSRSGKSSGRQTAFCLIHRRWRIFVPPSTWSLADLTTYPTQNGKGWVRICKNC